MPDGLLFCCCGCHQTNIGSITVFATQRIGGFSPFTYNSVPGDISPTLYQRQTQRRTGVEDVMGTLVPRWEEQRWWVHPVMGDIYRYELENSVDGIVETMLINDDGSRTDWVSDSQSPWHFTLPVGLSNPGPVITETSWEKTKVSDADPNIYATDRADLYDPVDRMSHVTFDWLQEISLKGNNPVVTYGGVLKKTGIGDALLAPTISIEYRRVGAVTRAFYVGYPSEVNVAGGGIGGFSNFLVALTNNGVPARHGPGIAGFKLVWQAAKTKVSWTDSRVTITSYQETRYDGVAHVPLTSASQATWYFEYEETLMKCWKRFTSTDTGANPKDPCLLNGACVGFFIVDPSLVEQELPENYVLTFGNAGSLSVCHEDAGICLGKY